MCDPITAVVSAVAVAGMAASHSSGRHSAPAYMPSPPPPPAPVPPPPPPELRPLQPSLGIRRPTLARRQHSHRHSQRGLPEIPYGQAGLNIPQLRSPHESV